MRSKHCRKAKKRMYNSREAALRAGTQRYGVTSNAYQCRHCTKWHLTRCGVPQLEEDPQIERIIEALGIGGHP